jgi:wingless-type MMTV integration site family protein 11
MFSGGREQAFVHALSTAALAQSISKACTQGATTKCSCGRIPNEPPPAEFKWGGCGDDLRFGMIFSASFADSPFLKRKKRSKKSLMNLHNNNAGRKVSLTPTAPAQSSSGNY